MKLGGPNQADRTMSLALEDQVWSLTIDLPGRPRFSKVECVLTELASSPLDELRRDRIVEQFIKDWNRMPQHRTEMLAANLPLPGHPFDIAITCAVVHCLCERDGLEIPSWVEGTRISPPKTYCGNDIDDAFSLYVVSQAPRTCEQYGVYFERELLES